MLLRSPEAHGFLRANSTFRAAVGVDDAELAQSSFYDWLDPADVELARAVIEGTRSSCEVRHRTREDSRVRLHLRVTDNDGHKVILARARDKSANELSAASPSDADDEATVIGTLHTIARILEEQNPGYKCSILLVADGRFVRGAGPSLPEDYNAAIDGFAIGPTVGSCGTAIAWGVPVIAEDIQNDPLWVPFADLAREAGVAAWLVPSF